MNESTLLVSVSKAELETMIRGQVMVGVRSILGERPAKQETTTPLPKRYYTTREAAPYLGVTEKYMSELCTNGDLASIKRGGRNYFLKEDLDAYMMRGRRKSSDQISDAALSNKKERR